MGPGLGCRECSVNSGGMRGPSVSDGRAVPESGGVTIVKLVFSFLEWGVRRMYSVTRSISVSGPNLSPEVGIKELFPPCSRSS